MNCTALRCTKRAAWYLPPLGKSGTFFAQSHVPPGAVGAYLCHYHLGALSDIGQSGLGLMVVTVAHTPFLVKDLAAVELGTRGGKARSKAKAEAARKNGAKGGRPKKS